MKVILPTTEEAQEIKNGNRALTDLYYFKNYDFIKYVVKCYLKGKTSISSWEDGIHDVYLYFSSLNFTTNYAMARSIKDICLYSRFGGQRVFNQYRQGETEILTILDEPAIREHAHGGEVETVGDLIEDPSDITEMIEPERSFTDDVFLIASSFLSDKLKEAFEYLYYTDLTVREIGEKLGVTVSGAFSRKNRCILALKKVSDEFHQRLENIGYFAS